MIKICVECCSRIVAAYVYGSINFHFLFLDGVTSTKRKRKATALVKRHFKYTIEEKDFIVAEAYATKRRVKATARKFGVQPTNRRARCAELKAKHTVEECDVLKLTYNGNIGSKPLHYDMCCAEYKRITGAENIPNTIIRHRIFRTRGIVISNWVFPHPMQPTLTKRMQILLLTRGTCSGTKNLKIHRQ